MIFILCFFIPFYVYGSDKKVNEVETLVKKPLSENDFEVKTNQNNKVSLTSLKNKRYAIYTDLSLRDQDYFSRKTHFKADIVNKSEHALKVILWVVGSNGWDAVPDVRELKPHEKQTFSCHLRETFPDGTHKINPNKVKFVQVMLPIAKVGDQLSIENFRTEGDCELWIKPKQRLEVPEMSEGKPQAGKRVRFSLDSSLKNTASPSHWRFY